MSKKAPRAKPGQFHKRGLDLSGADVTLDSARIVFESTGKKGHTATADDIEYLAVALTNTRDIWRAFADSIGHAPPYQIRRHLAQLAKDCQSISDRLGRPERDFYAPEVDPEYGGLDVDQSDPIRVDADTYPVSERREPEENVNVEEAVGGPSDELLDWLVKVIEAKPRLLSTQTAAQDWVESAFLVVSDLARVLDVASKTEVPQQKSDPDRWAIMKLCRAYHHIFGEVPGISSNPDTGRLSGPALRFLRASLEIIGPDHAWVGDISLRNIIRDYGREQRAKRADSRQG